jgi:hydrogenase maturation factor HypF (carbamoyltransferase family)
VAYLLGICTEKISYEAQAAIELENMANEWIIHLLILISTDYETPHLTILQYRMYNFAEVVTPSVSKQEAWKVQKWIFLLTTWQFYFSSDLMFLLIEGSIM